MAQNRTNKGQKMRTYKVNKTQLLKTLRQNLEKHKADVEKAWTEYKELVKLDIAAKKDAVERALKDLETRFDKNPNVNLNVGNLLYFDLTKPASYVKEYEEVIDGFTWEVNEEVELDSVEFVQYIRDDWDWKSDLENQRVFYAAKSVGFTAR